MYNSLQVARGFAAFAVAAFHLSIAMGDPKFGGDGTRVLWDWFAKGNLGVDFFFVLSGFIIFLAHERDIGRRERFRPYVIRRFTRMFPIYWIYLSAAVAGMVVVGSNYLRLETAGDWLTAYGLVRLTDVGLPLAQAWTLFHEVLFYAMFSLLILNRTLGLWALGLWFSAVALSLHYPASSQQDFAATLLSGYNLNFLLGMAACLLTRRHVLSHAWFAVIAGLGLLACTHALELSLPRFELVPLLYAVAFAVLISGIAALERLDAWRPPLVLAFVGNASYSIYLLHEHTEHYALRALNKFGVLHHLSPHVVFWLVLAVTILVGCLAYAAIERPLLRKLRNQFETRGKYVAIGGTT